MVRYLFRMVKKFGGGMSKVVPQQEIIFKVFGLFFDKGLLAKVQLWGRPVFCSNVLSLVRLKLFFFTCLWKYNILKVIN